MRENEEKSSRITPAKILTYQQIWNYCKYGIIARLVKIFGIMRIRSLSQIEDFGISFFFLSLSQINNFKASFLMAQREERNVIEYGIILKMVSANTISTKRNYRENDHEKGETPLVRNHRKNGQEFPLINGFLILR